jgi:ketosteroid isomerase-like protein
MLSNRARVESIYAAFGRGDIPAIMEYVGEDVRWDEHYGDIPVPWLKARRGRAGAMEFFASLAALEFKRFEVEAILAEGPLVVGLINLECVVKATGKTFVERREAHIWQFDANGKLVDFQHGADSYAHFRALQP